MFVNRSRAVRFTHDRDTTRPFLLLATLAVAQRGRSNVGLPHPLDALVDLSVDLSVYCQSRFVHVLCRAWEID